MKTAKISDGLEAILSLPEGRLAISRDFSPFGITTECSFSEENIQSAFEVAKLDGGLDQWVLGGAPRVVSIISPYRSK